MDKFKDEYIKECTALGTFKKLKWLIKNIWVTPIILVVVYYITGFWNANEFPDNTIDRLKYVLKFFSISIPAITILFIARWKALKKFKVLNKGPFFNNDNLNEILDNNFNELTRKYKLEKHKDRLIDLIDMYQVIAEKKKFSWVTEKALAGGIFLPIWISYVDAFFNIDQPLEKSLAVLLSLGFFLFLFLLFMKYTTISVFTDFFNTESQEYKILVKKLKEFKWEHWPTIVAKNNPKSS